MGYWFLIIFIFTILSAMIFCTYYLKVKNEDKETMGLSILSICFALSLTVYFGIDIPYALNGGQEIYVDKFPAVASMECFQLINTGEQQFISFKSYNPDKYEQDAEYCITYTKFTKIILNIEKVE